jgi:hypothetical protein
MKRVILIPRFPVCLCVHVDLLAVTQALSTNTERLCLASLASWSGGWLNARSSVREAYCQHEMGGLLKLTGH